MRMCMCVWLCDRVRMRVYFASSLSPSAVVGYTSRPIHRRLFALNDETPPLSRWTRPSRLPAALCGTQRRAPLGEQMPC